MADLKSGSTPKTDPVATEFRMETPGVTAGQLRAAGYQVPDDVPDDQIPPSYVASTGRTDAEPHLVQDHAPPGLVLHDKTPIEAALEGPAAEGGPQPTPIMGRTPVEQAKLDSAGTDAAAQGPRPTAEILSVTPTEAAGTPQQE